MLYIMVHRNNIEKPIIRASWNFTHLGLWKNTSR